jgi:eukaryotic-like serine/threonine-protein kinase
MPSKFSKLSKFVARHPRWTRAAIIVIALLLVEFIVDDILMPLYTRQGQERVVPALIGLSKQKAQLRADSAGFIVVEEPAKIGGHVPVGTILEQRPFAGSLAKPGRKIRVVPAAEAPLDAAPDLIGLELRDAQLRIKSSGLLTGDSDIHYRFSERYEKGTVVSQEPRPGNPIKPGNEMKLWVSLGAQPAHFYVPYIMEKTLSDARGLLRDAGLRLGKIVRKSSNQYPSGTVIAQSVRSGEEVPRETAVDVVVAVPESSH